MHVLLFIFSFPSILVRPGHPPANFKMNKPTRVNYFLLIEIKLARTLHSVVLIDSSWFISFKDTPPLLGTLYTIATYYCYCYRYRYRYHYQHDPQIELLLAPNPSWIFGSCVPFWRRLLRINRVDQWIIGPSVPRLWGYEVMKGPYGRK